MPNVITEYMREQNMLMHKANKKKARGYGGSGWKHAEFILNFAKETKSRSLLDYGCGEGSLRAHIKAEYTWKGKVHEYDPAIPGKEEAKLADLLVCTDVLEHVEPKLIGNVLRHMDAHAKRGAYLSIATRPSDKLLPDGRNAHVLLQDMEWWHRQLSNYTRFAVVRALDVRGEICAGREVRFWLRKEIA